MSLRRFRYKSHVEAAHFMRLVGQIAGPALIFATSALLVPNGAYGMSRKSKEMSLREDGQKNLQIAASEKVKEFVRSVDEIGNAAWNFYPVNDQSRRKALDLASRLAGEGMRLHPTAQPFQQAIIFDFIKSGEVAQPLCDEMHFDIVATQISISCKHADKTTIDALLKILGTPLKSAEGPIVGPHGTSVPERDQLVFYTSKYQINRASYTLSGKARDNFDEFKVTVTSK